MIDTPTRQNPSAIGKAIPRTIWVPFLFFAIQTTRGLMFWVHLALGKEVAQFNSTQVYVEGSPIDRIALSILILLALFSMRNRQERIIHFLRQNTTLVLFFSYMLLSLFWSDFRVITLRRLVRSFGMLVMVILIFTEEHPLLYGRRLIGMLAVFLIAGSLGLIIFFPSIGTGTGPAGEIQWLGLGVHKNMLGQYGAIGSVYFLWRFFYVKSVKRRLSSITLVPFALSVLILFGSKSLTSISVMIIGLLVLLSLELARRFGKMGATTVAIFLVALTAVALLVQNNLFDKPLTSYFLQAGGKDETLTGRTYIWHLALKDLQPREVAVGSGYEAFWLGRKADAIRESLSWNFYTAHEGYLDMFLQLGLIGIGLLLAYLLSALANIAKLRKVNYAISGLWSAFFLISIVSNFFESNFGVSSDLYWILTLVAGVSPNCFYADGMRSAEAPAQFVEQAGVPNFPL